MQAVILAGGKGTRLAERLQGRPKPLIDVEGAPLLERQISSLQQYGVDDVVLLVNHAADQIENYCAERGSFGLRRLSIIDDGEPRGTAGAVLACLNNLEETFLVVYGDTLFNIDISRFLAAHIKTNAEATLFVHPNDHPHDSDIVELGDDDAVSAFHSKPHEPSRILPNLVNAAFYAVKRSSLEGWRNLLPPIDFGADLFPTMLEAGQRLRGYRSFEYIKDIGTPQRLDKATDQLKRGVVARATLAELQACVFVDRDGTLNTLRGHIARPDDFELINGVPSAIRRLNDQEYRVAVVTNQPVIARGECSFETLRTIHAKLDSNLARSGAFVDRLYFCPHHPHAGFTGEVEALKTECSCRKPGSGMIRTAALDLNADLARSWMVGDSTSDVLAAQSIGLRSILVRTGEGGRDGKHAVQPDIVVDDFVAAVAYIVEAAGSSSNVRVHR